MQFQKPQNRWEGSFENLTTSTVKPVKKVMAEAVKITAEDVRKQLFGEKPPEQVPDEKQQQMKAEEEKRKAIMSRKMRELDEAIKKAREERLKKEQELKKSEEKKASFAKASEAKEPIWQKMMKMGSQAERRVNAGG